MTTIYQYFTDKLGAAPADDTLRQLPINSNTSGHPSGSADVRCWAQNGPPAMSAVWSLTGEKRTSSSDAVTSKKWSQEWSWHHLPRQIQHARHP
jgi:hypothetical protein